MLAIIWLAVPPLFLPLSLTLSIVTGLCKLTHILSLSPRVASDSAAAGRYQPSLQLCMRAAQHLGWQVMAPTVEQPGGVLRAWSCGAGKLIIYCSQVQTSNDTKVFFFGFSDIDAQAADNERQSRLERSSSLQVSAEIYWFLLNERSGRGGVKLPKYMAMYECVYVCVSVCSSA